MDKMDNNKGVGGYRLGYALEKLTQQIFENSGFEIITVNNDRFMVDIIAKNDESIYYIEIKTSTSIIYSKYSNLEFAAKGTVDYAKRKNASSVLVVFAVVPEESKQKLINSYGISVLDISNLLYIVNGTELQDELVSLLPFAVDHIKPVENELGLGWISHEDKGPGLVKQLDSCVSGKADAKVFEDICADVLNYLFADDLSLWKKQAQSNDKLFRFDLVCRIKDGISKSFWRIIESFFQTKYVVFEFKNYTDEVTQREIYTTERYLYSKALRNVAIIIAKNGFDENSIWAVKGSLREYGKLILPVTVDDLEEMIRIKIDKEDPSGFLLSKLDGFLVELEK